MTPDKAVVWCDSFALGFTGLAFIDPSQRKPVADWLAELLWRVDEWPTGIEVIRDEAQRAIARLPPWPDKGYR